MSNPKTTFVVEADIKNMMSGLVAIDNKLEDTTAKAVASTSKMGTGYTAASKQAVAGTTMMANGNKQAANTLTNLNWLVSDSPYLFQNMRMGIMSVSNNINPLLNNWTRMKKEFKTTKGVFKALGSQLTGPAGLATALTAVIAIVQVISIVMAKHKAKTEGSTSANKEFAESLKEIQKSTSIDSLQRQIEESEDLSKVTEKRIGHLKSEKDNVEANKKQIKEYLGVLRDNRSLYKDGMVVTKDDAKTKLESLLGVYLQFNAEADLNKDSYKDIIKYLDNSKDTSETILTQEKEKRAQSQLQLDIQKEGGLVSDKEIRYKEKLFEMQTARLPIQEQIVAWEQKKAELTGDSIDDKEKILEYDQNIAKLTIQKDKIEKEIADLQNTQLTNDEKITSYKTKQATLDQTKLEDMKEYLVLQEEIDKIQAASTKARDNAEKKFKQLRSGVDTESKQYLIDKISDIDTQLLAEEIGTEKRKELETELFNFKSDLWEKEKEEKEEMLRIEQQYQQNLAGIISQGGIEGIYEDMFSRIKEKVIQHWLDKLSITKAMMQMEEAITLLGEGKIQAFLDILFPKRIAQREAEATAAGKSAAIKSVDSASGIPFPGNIAAIGLVLASVFSSLRKAKVTGTQIVAAAEGAVINKPTLLLAGEALNRSGTEIVMPEKNFNRYMDDKIIPGIMAKVNIDNTGIRNELQQVKSAIYAIGREIPGATGKAVSRHIRSKF